MSYIDRSLAAGGTFGVNFKEFLADSLSSLDGKRSEDNSIVGLEYQYALGDKDCGFYYRSSLGSRKLQKDFWKDKGTCDELKGWVFSIVLQILREAGMTYKKVSFTRVSFMIPELDLALQRHPELAHFMREQGIRLISVPIPVKKVEVKAGDTIWGIANAAGDPRGWHAIATMNSGNIESWRRIPVGTHLSVPVGFGKEADIESGYQIRPGETLQEIAEKKLGDKKYWGLLYFLNRHQISKPDEIPANVKLALPKKPEAVVGETTEFVEFKAALR
jgi:nucleoid-associated protein YgaU